MSGRISVVLACAFFVYALTIRIAINSGSHLLMHAIGFIVALLAVLAMFAWVQKRVNLRSLLASLMVALLFCFVAECLWVYPVMGLRGVVEIEAARQREK